MIAEDHNLRLWLYSSIVVHTYFLLSRKEIPYHYLFHIITTTPCPIPHPLVVYIWPAKQNQNVRDWRKYVLFYSSF